MFNKKIKAFVANIVFHALGRAMKGVYKIDKNMIEYVESLPDDYKVRVKVSGISKKLVFAKIDGELKVYKSDEAPLCVDLDLVFKSIDVAIPLLVGMKGAGQAFADHDFIMKGDICESMTVVKIIDLVESYLFPNFMLKKILNGLPKREKSKIRLYTYFILGI